MCPLLLSGLIPRLRVSHASTDGHGMRLTLESRTIAGQGLVLQRRGKCRRLLSSAFLQSDAMTVCMRGS